MSKEIKKPVSWSWLVLFTTSGTLICCAIPILFVTLGMGAAVASMASAAPWLVTLSMHKGWVFTVSGVLIAFSICAVYRPGRVCPSDPELAVACERADKWNRRITFLSAGLWLVGFFAAFVLPLLQ